MEASILNPLPPVPQAAPSAAYFAGAYDFAIGKQYNITHTHSGDTSLLDLLNPVPDASHFRNRKTSPPDSICVEGTRRAALKQVTSWIDGGVLLRSASHILWLYGSVGCGKSAIAQTVAEHYSKKNRLLASFFFFRGSGARSKSSKLAVTLASQLAAAIPSTAPSIETAIRSHAGLLTTCPLTLQLQLLFLDPFQSVIRGGKGWAHAAFKGSFIVVLDGVDECVDREEVAALIDHLLRFFHDNPRIPLRIFISSRVEEHIRTHLSDSQVQMVNLVDHASFEDILFVINRTFDDAAKHSRVLQAHGEWPRASDRRLLAEHAGGSFAFMSTILRYILGSPDEEGTREERLSRALRLNPGLDALYTHTFSRSESLPHFGVIIRTIALVHQPLSIAQLAHLLQLKTHEVIQVLINLQAIIQVPGDDYDPVTLYHTSLRDFLTTQSRSGRFFASPDHHRILVVRSLTILNASLDESYPPSPGSAADYARSYWRSHWEALLDHGRFRTPDPQLQLRRYLRTLVNHFHSMWPELCEVLLPLWSVVDRSLLDQLRVNIHDILNLALSKRQNIRFSESDPRWRAMATTVLSALTGAVNKCQDVLDVYREMPDTCDRNHSPSFNRPPSHHMAIASLGLSHLFPLLHDAQARSKTFWESQMDPGQRPATVYLFFALPQHLTAAFQCGLYPTRVAFLRGLNVEQGKRRFLTLVHQSWSSPAGYGIARRIEDLWCRALESSLGSFSWPTGSEWSPTLLEELKLNTDIATAAIGRIFPEFDHLQVRGDWGFVRAKGPSGREHTYTYTSSRGDFSVSSLWAGYLNVVGCFLSQQGGTHDTNTCRVEGHIRRGIAPKPLPPVPLTLDSPTRRTFSY